MKKSQVYKKFYCEKVKYKLAIIITNKKIKKLIVNIQKMNAEQKQQKINADTQKSIQNQHQSKLEQLILDLNKTGLKLLTEGSFDEAIQYLKKAEKIIIKQGIPLESNCTLVQLAGITYNNLACYYKKTKKPKVALKYLKKALQIEVFRLNNWTSIAGTHLNICAIYSFMKNHQQAANHAQLAISFLQKVSFDIQDQSDEAKSYWNVFMLSYYNLAIEKQYLKDYQQAIKNYQKSKQIAQNSGKRNVSILISCDQSICRLQPLVQNLRKKIIQSIKKKQQNDEKGHAEYILFNKKNYGIKNQNDQDIQTQKVINYLRRIAHYNETPVTTAGNRFRSRKIPNTLTKTDDGSSFNKRVNSLTSFNKRYNGNTSIQQRKVRLMTENDVDQRDQSKRYSSKQFQRSYNIPKAS